MIILRDRLRGNFPSISLLGFLVIHSWAAEGNLWFQSDNHILPYLGPLGSHKTAGECSRDLRRAMHIRETEDFTGIHAENGWMGQFSCLRRKWVWRKNDTCRAATQSQWQLEKLPRLSCRVEDRNSCLWRGTKEIETKTAHHHALTAEGCQHHIGHTWEGIQWERWVGWGYSPRCVVGALPADEMCYVRAEKWPSPHSLGLWWWDTSVASQISLLKRFVFARWNSC